MTPIDKAIEAISNLPIAGMSYGGHEFLEKSDVLMALEALK